MHLLIVAATEFEVEKILSKLGNKVKTKDELYHGKIKNHVIDVLITGVGMCSTSFFLGKSLHVNYDLLINVGVAGAFDDNLEIGEVVQVSSDFFAELGAENGDSFIPFNEMKLPGFYEFHNSYYHPKLENIKSVKSCTVNTVHGNKNTIASFKNRFPDVQLESMEGAAFAMSAEIAKKPYLQIRSISNRVEARDTTKWELKKAIINLNEVLIDFILELN